MGLGARPDAPATPRTFDMAEEFEAQAGTHDGTFDQTRNVGHDKSAIEIQLGRGPSAALLVVNG